MSAPFDPSTFDPDAAAPEDSGLFGLPLDQPGAEVAVTGVPFDAPPSYRKGAARVPAAILQASRQIDLFDLVTGHPYERGIRMIADDPDFARWNSEASARTARVHDFEAQGDERERLVREADELGARVNERVYEHARAVLAAERLPVVVGGDHSTPFGAIRAAAERFPGLGVLHFDAHADLRVAFEGFEWSHASILHNVLAHTSVARLVQVGLRDVAGSEVSAIEESGGRIRAVFDHDWGRAKLEGRDLRALVRDALAHLPDTIWITFDVDGLDPTLCPRTGTPVPGGLGWHEAMLWLEETMRAGKRVVGCDLNEVSPGPEWEPGDGDTTDAIVGARLLYRLIGTALATRH